MAKKAITKLFARQGFILILTAAVLVEGTSLIQYLFSKKGLRDEADRRAQSELEISQLQVEKMTMTVQQITESTAWALEDQLGDPDHLYETVQRMMDRNPVVVNGFAAFLPNYYPQKGRWYEQVLSRWGEGNHYEVLTFTSESHDYLSTEWFNTAVQTGEGYWSEPYFDKDGVSTMVVTYATPLKNPQGETVGIFGVDISLEWLTEIVSAVQPYEDSYGTIHSKEGQLIAMPPETLSVNNALRYNTPLKGTGWTLSLIIPEEEVYGDMRRVNRRLFLMQLLGLLLLALIIQRTAKGQIKLDQAEAGKQKLEDELVVASDIQMSMIPKIFPPFPERTDIDLAAVILPAKEVGGDLYDFYIHDEKLYFCIGDVSGKGVPAALVMAVTRSLFRSISAQKLSAGSIVSSMNDAIAADNDRDMFVTFFCGILDMRTGNLCYCNAGHNAPVLLSDDKHMLPVIPNLPLGVMPGMKYDEQEIQLHYDDALFLYTDGLTEAENNKHELFGEERMRQALSGRKASTAHLEQMQKTVHGFVGSAPQSDDLTMLFLHYLNPDHPTLHHLVLHNDVQEIPQLAQLVDTIAEEKRLDPSLAMQLNLALEEAITNVMLYAYPKGTQGIVDMHAILRINSLEFTISDSGAAFDPTAKPDPDLNLSVEERPIGGLGIFLVRQIMDKVEYERRDGKNYLRMIKNI